MSEQPAPSLLVFCTTLVVPWCVPQIQLSQQQLWNWLEIYHAAVESLLHAGDIVNLGVSFLCACAQHYNARMHCNGQNAMGCNTMSDRRSALLLWVITWSQRVCIDDIFQTKQEVVAICGIWVGRDYDPVRSNTALDAQCLPFRPDWQPCPQAPSSSVSQITVLFIIESITHRSTSPTRWAPNYSCNGGVHNRSSWYYIVKQHHQLIPSCYWGS